MSDFHTNYKHKLCVPVIVAINAPLRFREWTPNCELKQDHFKVNVPIIGSWLVPKCIIVPLLAFDKRGYRLGYGGGYYDRTIIELRQSYNVYTIGLAFAGQESEHIPIDEFDQKLDAIVTEKKIFLFQ